MSVTNQTPIGAAIGNGVTIVFPFAYYVGAPADLVVKINGLTMVLGVDYTVSGAGNQSGGNIIMSAPPAVGARVSHFRDTSLTRATDYQDSGDLRADVLNLDLDRVWLALQEIFNGGKGAPTAVRVPPGEVIDELPSASLRAGRLMGFGPAGELIATLPTPGDATALALDLANTGTAKGGELVGFRLPTAAAIARSLYAKVRETVSVLDFGADPTGVADSTAAFQAAVDYVQAVGAVDPHSPSFAAAGVNLGRLTIPAGVYRITAPIIVSKPCVIVGDGIRRTVIRFATSNAALFAFNIGPTVSGANLVGGSFGGMTIICNAGATVGNGIFMATGPTASATTQFVLHDMGIYNCRTGVSQTGVIYMSAFRNITVAGTFGGGVLTYGWYVTSPQEVIYNSYTDLEVTVVESGAQAYYFQVAACQFRNLTADGVCYFSNPYGAVKGLSIEGIHAATVPAPAVVTLNQCDALEDVAIINCPTAKTSIGISVVGRCNISNVRWPDAGAGNQPDTPLSLNAGSSGTVTGFQVLRAVANKVEVGSLAAMNNWVFTACGDITDYDLTYRQGNWTPTFPSGWTTTPTVISAQWTRIGRQVTVALYCQSGVATAGAQVGGLPFSSNSTHGAAVHGCGNDPADVLRGSITPSSSLITNIPAVTLTGNFWQMTATYFV